MDFVDFLVAKTFTATCEEWFSKLSPVPQSKFAAWFSQRLQIARIALSQTGRASFAIFMAGFLFFSEGKVSASTILYAACLGLLLWAVTNVLASSASRSATKQVGLSVLPTVILLTDGDTKAYKGVRERSAGALTASIRLATIGLIQIALNIVASYLYAAVT
ncbi:hypothetical protein [Sphingomonas sp. TZW2008]|uniref:hypothetical protein n=1 Tax=Sphingomonas sp. TZW2008 TaxID=1917973 RepID=UPI00118179EC|nr:hypothetical protein [Sphingomonas sp. TZW2008]